MRNVESRMEDFYQILEVDRNATADEIKKSYRKLAMKYHPDHNNGDPEAENLFKEIVEAYEVLSDEDKRRTYDTIGHNAWKSNGSGGGPYSGFTTSDAVDINEIIREHFGRHFGENFDVFSDVFGGNNNSWSPFGKSYYYRRQTRTNRSVNVKYSITLEEAFTGKDSTYKYKLPNGDENTVSFNIPPGVNDGARLTIRGKGENEIKSAPPGDLHITFNIMDHPTFFRGNHHDLMTDMNINEDDLITRLTVDVFDAMTGVKKVIDTLDGKSIKVDIPAGSQYGKIFRINGRGMPIYGTKKLGDMYIFLEVDIPSIKDMSSDEKTKLKKMHDEINNSGTFFGLRSGK